MGQWHRTVLEPGWAGRGVVALVCAVAAMGGPVAAQQGAAAQAAPAAWQKEMAGFEAEDAASAPVPGGIVFVGSSSIRLWDLRQSFPDLEPVNRGFGGSEIADSVEHVDLLVLRHKPRTVIFYAGDNDLAAGKTPAVVAADYRAFVGKVRAALPQTRIAFIAIKPSLLRWAIVGKVREANALIRAYSESDDRLGFVDVDGPMLGWDEKPRKDLLQADGLHLTPKGYELWNTLVRPFLD